MKKTKPFFQTVLMFATLWLAAYSANLRAEDIDIYVDNGGIGNTPNVLFVIDNSSNMGSNWSSTAGCQAYANSTEAPSIGPTTAGGIVQCALVDAINSLPNGGINIGIMSGNASGFATSRGCVGKDGGCLLYPLTEMSATSKTELVTFVKSWIHENATKPGQFPFTVQSVPTDGMMQEAWAYYNGKTGRSGRTYSPSVLEGCQKNFIIYIGNTDKTPSNDAETGPLLAAATTVDDWRKKIVERQVFKPDPGICGAKKIGYLDAGSSSSDWSSNWGDEWARLMFKTDAGTPDMEGMQNVATYSIGIINNDVNQCTADYPALLQSMGVEGGGKAFRVSNASEVTKALATALNEVQAVNSVFSSASLPVSVNAEGSYLNQIFLGMFRPDSSGAPRWLGNLKQYQLVRTTGGALVMGDSKGDPALSSGGTGFLSPDAISFWTYKDPASLPDNVGGFFVNNKMGTPGHGFDLADGEVVEKGGVAQQLRKQNLVATFDGAGGTTVNPRKVYTFCPDGGTDAAPCQKDLKHADNDFSTANTKIAAATFGSAVTVPILSIVRTGTEALVTTSGNHGFTATSSVTIRNSDQPEYNKTQNVTVVNATQFRITGLPDYPTTPSTAGYTISVPGGAGTFDIASMSRSSSTTVGSAAETVTVTTTADHPYLVGQTVQISGVTPAEFYAGNKVITGVPTARTFTFSVPIYPASPALNSYSVAHRATSAAISSITKGASAYTVETSQAHGFHAGQTIDMNDVKGKWQAEYNNPMHTVVSVTSDRIFTIGVPAGSPDSNGAQGSVSPSTVPKAAAGVSRNGTTASTTATVTGMPAKWFANGDKVNITSTGSYLNEDAYKAVSEVTITCSGDCTSFTYPITATPPLTATGAGTVSIPGAGASATVAAGDIARVGTTATVSNVTPSKFLPNSVVQIQPTSGTALSSESGYIGSWQINCGADTTCSKFTFGPVTLSPTTPATGSSMQAYSGNTAPDKNLMIKWLRGQDNQGDEKGPGNGVTVRPSMHGDVLHSRPLVVNYGDSRGIVVFYGSNDGVYRAVNGNQKDAANGTPAGGELWGLILPEHYQLINRYRANSPELKFPSTFLVTAQPKDYFVDGPTGVYQKLKADGSIDKAYIYLTMRRGGRLVYAIDVTDPTSPKYLWHISQQTPGFEELGQTWSRPRLTLLQNHKWVDPSSASTTPVPTPVLVFGAGYDPSQDSEPPKADTMGRGMFVINAITGDLVWSASKTCDSTTHSCTKVDGMKYATSSDISFVDRDLNGYTDKMYWGDLGGNLWRADVSDPDVTKWAVTRVAQLGCDTGECAAGTTPRKFFFPPAVLSVRVSGAADSYEALSIVSGDREHPLRSDAPQSSYNVTDKFFMIKDLGTTVAPIVGVAPTSGVTASSTDLFDATSTLYDNSKKGFFITLLGSPADSLIGEKAVNAPVAVNGMIFFSTNRPIPPTRQCAPTLGEAKAYAVSPFTGKSATNVLQGGGLPPSAVSGLITITERDAQGNVTGETQEKFCIGCGLSGEDLGGTNTNPCTSALENCNIGVTIPKNLKRTYWYKK